MSASSLVFDDGDQVLARGDLRFRAGQWVLDCDQTRTLELTNRPREPRHAVPLVGAEALIADLQAREPQRWRLLVHVIGIWQSGSVRAESTGLGPGPGVAEPRLRLPDDPPGPEPAGGWPTSGGLRRLDVDMGDLLERGVVVTARQALYSGDRLLLVVAATDVDAARAHLEPQIPGRVCIVPTTVSRSQLDEVRATVESRWREWGVEGAGFEAVDEDGQPYAVVGLFRVTDDVAAWTNTFPVGLIRLDPSVRRLSRRA